MTNQEWLLTQTPEEVLEMMHWLIETYGKGYTQSDTAIVEWLSKDYKNVSVSYLHQDSITKSDTKW